MMRVQGPVVAGMFYPGDPAELAQQLDGMLARADGQAEGPPQALIAPHAGYIYSGPVAANAYASLAPVAAEIRRVVVMAPSHRVGFQGVAVSSADVFRTPLGDIPVDRAAVDQLLAMPQVRELDQAFAAEHALEVQLPFLQRTLGDFLLVPLVAGEAAPAAVAEVLAALWEEQGTLVVISSDLSHFHDYATAQLRDRETTAAIEALREGDVSDDGACGRVPVRGLLREARQRGLHVQTLDLRNSGDTAGARDRVVGHGAYVFY